MSEGIFRDKLSTLIENDEEKVTAFNDTRIHASFMRCQKGYKQTFWSGNKVLILKVKRDEIFSRKGCFTVNSLLRWIN